MDDRMLEALCNQADVACNVIFRASHFLGDYIEFEPSDDKYLRVFLLAPRGAHPVFFKDKGDSYTKFKCSLGEFEAAYRSPYLDWQGQYSRATLDAFFVLAATPSVLTSLGLEQRMVDEVRDERWGINTMYRTTNYQVTCFLESIEIRHGRDKKSVVLDRDLFEKFGRGDLYRDTLSTFARQHKEWREMADLSRKGTFARRHRLLALLPE